MMEPVKGRLGVDIGGVIIQRSDESDDTSFWGDNYLATPAVPGAFEALRQLREGRFGADLFVVSKSGAYTEWRAREWLRGHRLRRHKGGARPQNKGFPRPEGEGGGAPRHRGRPLRRRHHRDVP